MLHTVTTGLLTFRVISKLYAKDLDSKLQDWMETIGAIQYEEPEGRLFWSYIIFYKNMRTKRNIYVCGFP